MNGTQFSEEFNSNVSAPRINLAAAAKWTLPDSAMRFSLAML
jgi:hypothetical protein